jgi:hypothetical protein
MIHFFFFNNKIYNNNNVYIFHNSQSTLNSRLSLLPFAQSWETRTKFLSSVVNVNCVGECLFRFGDLDRI